MIQNIRLKRLIRNALDEDIGSGDVTTSAVLIGNEDGLARAETKEDIVVAGIEVFREVFFLVDSDLRFASSFNDGSEAKKGEVLAEISGCMKNILMAERVALNFLQRMCGIASMTRRFVEKVNGTKAKIIDTRKTTPCLRDLEKYAVRMGGGFNHRFGLYGGVLIKDNHIRAAGSILNAVKGVRNRVPPTLKVEVEVKSIEEIKEAILADVDIIMLDNMDTEKMKRAVTIINGKALVEASGNVTLSRVREIAETGVDFISVGALTHSASSADISLNMVV
jgi:nicotinate-nucleotide pyrophosphorylase (carboxylating)